MESISYKNNFREMTDAWHKFNCDVYHIGDDGSFLEKVNEITDRWVIISRNTIAIECIVDHTLLSIMVA